jgi:hypothetical protein
MSSCPSGFDPGTASTCHVHCPDAFEYSQEYGGERCVLRTDRSKQVVLTALPFSATAQQQTAERTRVQQKIDEIQTALATRAELESAKDKPDDWVKAYDLVQQRHAAYTGASTAIDETLQRLRAQQRPPVAPAEDLSADRRWLLSGQYEEPDVRFFQIALILLVLSTFSYFVLSTPVAHIVTTVLLCVGAAVGFFLKT